MKNFLEYILIVFFSVVLLIAGNRLYKIWEEYHVAGDEYEKLRQYIEEPGAEKETEQNKHETDNQEASIDFESLKKINPDIVAWIHIEDVGIDYPIVQGTDNEHYLHYTFSGEANIAGSIFLDYRNNGFLDYKAILYGHNMRDGSMFAALKNLDISEQPVIEIYTPDHTLQYLALSVEYVSPNDKIYEIADINAQDGSIERFPAELILSTCSSDSTRRLVIIAERVNN